MSVKNFIICIALLFCACSNPSGSGNEDDIKNYAIIFNRANDVLGEPVALAVINSDGSGLKKIGTTIDSPQQYSVSDDGRKVVYASNDIIVADIETETQTMIPNEGKGRYPKISPNGAYIVYEQYSGNSIGINVINVDGTNRKLIIPDDIPLYFDWSADSKGIYFAYWNGSGYSDFFYIDKDGINEPVKVETQTNYTKIMYALSEFDQTALTFKDDRDSISFSSYQVNNTRDKAWEFMSLDTVVFSNGRPRIIKYTYFLGYDLNNMTVKILADSNLINDWNSVSWAPNGEVLAVFTLKGLEIIRFDEAANKILDYDLDRGQISQINHQWIPRLK